MSNLQIKQRSDWKALKLEGSVFSGGLEGLIGIEELSDYKLERSNKRSRTSSKDEETVTKKSKPTDAWLVEENGEVNEHPKKRKSKQKEKSKETKTKTQNVKKKETKKINSKKVQEKKIQKNYSLGSEETDERMENVINTEAWSTLGVPSEVIKALNDQKFETPTPIQSLTLAPAILGRRDILGAAETGSGKTLAFGIPIINGILELKKKAQANVENEFDGDEENEEVNNSDEEDNQIDEDTWFNVDDEDSEVESADEVEEDDDEDDDEDDLNENGIGCVKVIDNIEFVNNEKPAKPLYALILTPTRELAIQIKNHFSKAAKYTDIKVAVIVGGMAAVKQERILNKGPEIVIATPGRLWELIEEGNSHLSQLSSIKFLAIDETDRMLEQGHFQELHSILQKINTDEVQSKQRQTFVFSATLTMVHDIPEYLKKKKRVFSRSKIFKLTPGQKLQRVITMLGIKNPKIVDVTKQTGTANSLTECRIACTIDHKDYYLYYFLKRHEGRTLVFCNSIGCVKRLATLFGILECNPLPLHASMQQRQRLRNLERFQEDNNGLLIATDVAARGLDIPNVEHVIHYQVPRTSEGYVHRSGRTARAQKEGITVLMMEPSEKDYYSRLCKTLGRTEDLPTFPVVDRLLIAVKERVNVAREIDKLELTSKRNNVQKSWLQKAVEDMDLLLDEDQIETTMEEKTLADLKRQLKAKKHQLASLLSKPLFPKGFSGKYPDTNLKLNLSDKPEKAVDIMKKVIKQNPKKKKKPEFERRT